MGARGYENRDLTIVLSFGLFGAMVCKSAENRNRMKKIYGEVLEPSGLDFLGATGNEIGAHAFFAPRRGAKSALAQPDSLNGLAA
jgi:hypothetical protein